MANAYRGLLSNYPIGHYFHPKPNSSDPCNGVGLTPDWAFVDDFGTVYFRRDAFANIDTTLFSWDAFCTSWRVYFELNATNGAEGRASNYLNYLSTFYQEQFNVGQQIMAVYYYSGLPVVNYTSPIASGIPLLASSLDYSIPIDLQVGAPSQTTLAYILKSAPINSPFINQFSGPNTFQGYGAYGYFIAPGDSLDTILIAGACLDY